MQLGYLADHPSQVPLLAEWHHRQFGYLNPANRREVYADRLKAGCQKSALPVTIIATDGPELLGSASLVRHTIIHQHLSPWLSSVYVAPTYRGRGLGSALVGRIEQEAASIAFETIYLFTPDSEALYAGLGWEFMEKAAHGGLALTVMSKSLKMSSRSSRSD